MSSQSKRLAAIVPSHITLIIRELLISIAPYQYSLAKYSDLWVLGLDCLKQKDLMVQISSTRPGELDALACGDSPECGACTYTYTSTRISFFLWPSWMPAWPFIGPALEGVWARRAVFGDYIGRG